MKSFLLGAALLITGVAQAQITQETRYKDYVTPYKLSTGDIKYAGYFSIDHTFRIYNANHSLYKSVAVPGIGYVYNNDNCYVSDKLFNSTPELEFVIGANYPAQNVKYLKVINESGVVLLSVDSCATARILNTATGSKMLAYVESQPNSSTRVFALAGTYTPLAIKATSTEELVLPYPNPTTAEIQLPYQLSAGQTGTLSISNALGQQMNTYQVDNTFSQLLVDTRTLAPGVYFYRVSSKTGTSAAQRFVVR